MEYIEYIYLEKNNDLVEKEDLYKIGKGFGYKIDISNKMMAKKQILFFSMVYNSKKIYEEIIENMKKRFVGIGLCGKIYFKGSFILILNTILNIVQKHSLFKNDELLRIRQRKKEKKRDVLHDFLANSFDIDYTKIETNIIMKLYSTTRKSVVKLIKYDDTIARDMLYTTIQNFFEPNDNTTTFLNNIKQYYTDDDDDIHSYGQKHKNRIRKRNREISDYLEEEYNIK